jgi:hypothetical protein
MSESESESRADRRDRYHRLLETIRHNTGDPQHVLAPGAGLWTVLSSSNIDTSDAITAMEAAIDNGHVLQWTDADGRHRYGLTGAGIDEARHTDAPLYGPADRERLRAVLATEADRDEPDKSVIAWANRRLAAIDGVGEE